MTMTKPSSFSNLALRQPGTDKTIQPGWYGVRLTPAAPSRKFTLPAGTVIWSRMVSPASPRPTAGTVDVGPTGNLAAYGDDISLSAPSMANIGPFTLLADTEINVVATGLDGEVVVQLQANSTEIRD